jgi:5-methylcytosine-specific restriction endonuclease McrA
MPILNFKYTEDKQYFAKKLSDGSIERLEKYYANQFDFRNPVIKRKEFNAHRNELMHILRKRSDGICEICRKSIGTEIDHIVPLSTNVLNKNLRNLSTRVIDGVRRKAPSESYGSNHISNLQLACKICNRKKWNSA